MTYLVLTVAAGLNPYETLYFYSNGVNDLWVWGGGTILFFAPHHLCINFKIYSKTFGFGLFGNFHGLNDLIGGGVNDLEVKVTVSGSMALRGSMTLGVNDLGRQ